MKILICSDGKHAHYYQRMAWAHAFQSCGFDVAFWDKNAVNSIEKALNESNLGVNPVVNGTNIHIKFPPLTQERRLDLNKIVKKEGENIKVTLRNIRRNANTAISNLEKEKKISKDFERDYIIEIQELTDKYIKTSETIVSKKIEEISEV